MRPDTVTEMLALKPGYSIRAGEVLMMLPRPPLNGR